MSGTLTYANLFAGAAFSVPIMREFTLTSTVLGLLLVFRTNSSTARYNDARACWGQVINSSRTLLRNAGTKVLPQDPERFAHIVSLVRALPRALIFHLCNDGDLHSTTTVTTDSDGNECVREHSDREVSSEEALREQLTAIIADDGTVDKIMASAHRPMTVLNLISRSVVDVQLDPLISQRLDSEIRTLENTMGQMERILLTPIPTMYSRHTSRFISAWGFFLLLHYFPCAGSTQRQLHCSSVTRCLELRTLG